MHVYNQAFNMPNFLKYAKQLSLDNNLKYVPNLRTSVDSANIRVAGLHAQTDLVWYFAKCFQKPMSELKNLLFLVK